jgi:hypothetical protein
MFSGLPPKADVQLWLAQTHDHAAEARILTGMRRLLELRIRT